MNYIKTSVKKLFKSAILSACAIISIGTVYTVKAQAAPKDNTQFTVVIDAGHGSQDHGAVDNDAREKDINLGVAKKLASLIKKKLKNVKVVMTRDNDSFISLQGRADIANQNKADLFISIHTNSVDKSNPKRASISGASVYTLGSQKDANNLKVAQRENSVIELEKDYKQKYSNFDPSKDESYIIFEMAQKKNLAQSIKFADLAQKELVSTAGRADRGVKQAGFWVLWATSMPSVLVELDFICNPNEAKFLTSEDGQNQLAEALFNALQTYIGQTPAVKNQSKKSVASTTAAQPAQQVTEQPVTMVNIDEEGEFIDGIVLASDDSRESTRTATKAAPKVPTKSGGPRKRRSAVSKEKSNERVVETKDIEIKQEETTFIALTDEVQNSKPAETVVADNSQTNSKKNSKDKGKNNKKNDKNNKVKENKKQEEKALVKKEEPKKQDNKSDKKKADKNDLNQNNNVVAVTNKNRPNRKTIKVTSRQSTENNPVVSENVAVASTPKSTTNQAVTTEMKTRRPIMPVPEASKNSGEKKYKILLHESPQQLSADDPIFAGYTPTEYYKENNLYKYTYGGSTNRHEIESKLLEIKSRIPRATIIMK